MRTVSWAGFWGETIDVALSLVSRAVSTRAVYILLLTGVSNSMERPRDSNKTLENSFDKREDRGYFKIQARYHKK